MKRFIIPLCALTLFLNGCVALQQDVIILEERLMAVEFKSQELQEKNAELQRQLQDDLSTLGNTRKSTERSLRTKVAHFNANMEGMQQDIRILKGRVEEIEYLINRKVGGYEASGKKNTERMDEMGLALAKIEQRLTRMEQYLNIEGKSGAAAAPAPNTAQTAKPASGSEKEIYDLARQAYDNGQMDKARQNFQKLIQSFPKSENADNAQFWIGESYYREKWYERAILEYQTVIEKYPQGNKVPAAMLKQGLALLQIGEQSSARLILQELIKKYPQASESTIAKKKLDEF